MLLCIRNQVVHGYLINYSTFLLFFLFLLSVYIQKNRQNMSLLLTSEEKLRRLCYFIYNTCPKLQAQMTAQCEKDRYSPCSFV